MILLKINSMEIEWVECETVYVIFNSSYFYILFFYYSRYEIKH